MESKSVNEMLEESVAGHMVCISLPDQPHEPWMLGVLQGAAAPATASDVAEAQKLGFNVKEGASVLQLTKYEPFEIDSRRLIETKVLVVVPAGR